MPRHSIAWPGPRGAVIRRLTLLVLIFAGGATGAARGDSDLDDLVPANLPWQAEFGGTDSVHRVLDRGWVQPLFSVPDGDTTISYTAQNPGVMKLKTTPTAIYVLWQHNLPPAYCGRTPCASVEGLWDVDGDGRKELVLCSAANDRSRWLIQALDAGTGRIVTEVILAAGQDRHRDDGWDGLYAVAGVTDVDTAEGPRRAFLVMAEAGFDLEPRGVLAVETLTGRTLWSRFAGAKPSPVQTAAADLDGDGRCDVVYMGGAVGNLHGRTVNGSSDAICQMIAVGSDGRLLWQQDFPDNIAGHLAVADVDDDGVPEVVAALSGRDAGGAILAVLDGATGRRRDVVGLDGGPLGMGLATRRGLTDIYVGLKTVGIRRYRWDRRLQAGPLARSERQPAVVLVADLLPDDGPEVCAADLAGRVYVLDADLRPLSYAPDGGMDIRPGGMAVLFEPGDAPWLLVEGNGTEDGARFRFQRSRRALPWGALAMLPAAGGVVWYVRRRRRGTSPATRRELRLQLLARLELSGHGAIGALRCLRRLVWLLDARAQAAGVTTDLDVRLENLSTECRAHTLPDLAGLLELAELAGCDHALTAQARGAHHRLADLLAESDPGDDRQVDEELQRTGTLLEATLKSLRRDLEADFAADLAAVTRRVLAAHADAVAGAGVTVATSGLDEPVWCRIDAEELVFVVDNLVENAVRAMAASVQRELTLTARRTGNRILLQVQDTGCGIAPDDWETVLETRLSTREGGGLGLPESRRLLRKYGGSLTVTASQAGTGTTLTMSVAPARAREVQ